MSYLETLHAIRNAVASGNLQEVMNLLERYGPLKADTAINAAARYGQTDIFDYLVEQYPEALNLRNVLINAARGGHLGFVRWVIEGGHPADIFMATRMARQEGHTDVANYLQSISDARRGQVEKA